MGGGQSIWIVCLAHASRTERRNFAALHAGPNLLRCILILAPGEQAYEAARVHCARRRYGGRVAARYDGAGSGAQLSPRYLNAPSARCACDLRFLDELRSGGFIEGQNLTIDFRDFARHGDLISEYAAEQVKAQVDAIFAGGATAIRAVQHATKTIPILGISEDMAGKGLVDSMARPNGNTTGISILATELNGKRLEIIIEAVPGLRRVGALSDSNTTTEAKLHSLQEVAHANNVELPIHQVAKGDEYQQPST